MNWLVLLSFFFGGVFAANAVPHFVAGTMGRAYRTPFARPPGRGLSSPTVNVIWGVVSGFIGYLFVVHVGESHPRSWAQILAFGLGVLLLGIGLARRAGQLPANNTFGDK